jgi:hypothetical protein
MSGIPFLLNVKYPLTERVGFVHELMKGLNFKCGYIWIISWKNRILLWWRQRPGYACRSHAQKERFIFKCQHFVRASFLHFEAPTGRIFMKFLYEYFQKSFERTQVSLKHDKSNGYFTWRSMYTCDSISLNSYWNEKSLKQICRETQNPHFIFNKVLFKKLCLLWDNVEKWHSQTVHRWKYNAAHVLDMLGKWGYKHKLRTRRIYCISTAKTVTWKRFSFTLYIHTLPVSLLSPMTFFLPYVWK